MSSLNLRRQALEERARRDDPQIGQLELEQIVVADPADPPWVSRDRRDDYLVALAHAAGAPVLVSGDDDLLELELHDLRIVSPRAFLELLPP